MTEKGVDNESSEVSDEKDSQTLSTKQLAKLASQAFEDAQNAQKNGDWAGYGKYLDKLEEYLNQLAG